MADHTAESSFILVPLGNKKYPGMFAIVDEEDAERVLAFRWRVVLDHKTFYAYRHIPKSKRINTPRYQAMHRFILGDDAGYMVDHINHNGIDNRKSNLRSATNALNQGNGRMRTNASGFRGVRSRRCCWVAQIRDRGKIVTLGRFDNPVSAAIAYDNAAREIFGEFATTNFEPGSL